MVLDEPTSNLDVHAIEELKQTLLGWKAEGKTIGDRGAPAVVAPQSL